MLGFLITVALGIVVIASSLQFFASVRREEIALQKSEHQISSVMQAELYLKQLAAKAGNDSCGENWNGSIWLNSTVPKSFRVIQPISSALIHDFGLLKSGNGKWLGGSVLEIISLSAGTQIVARTGSNTLILKDHISVKKGATVLVTDCSTDWLAVVKSLKADGENTKVNLKAAVPGLFLAGDFVEPWHQDIIYVGQLGKSREDESALYDKTLNGRRSELVPGIETLKVLSLQPHFWELSLNGTNSVLVSK